MLAISTCELPPALAHPTPQHKLTYYVHGFLFACHTRIYEVAEKSPQQQFEHKTMMSAVITLWESLTRCQTIHLHHE